LARISAPKIGFRGWDAHKTGKEHGYDPQMKPLWQMLYAGSTAVILGSHDHHYERFARQDPDGNPDPRHAGICRRHRRKEFP
jgi:hypothetical protein